MVDCQLPLFDRADMSELFNRHLAIMDDPYGENGLAHSNLNEMEILDRFYFEIVPIEIRMKELLLEPDCDGVSDYYVLEVPYVGEPELWHYYPVCRPPQFDGEVFRWNLNMRSYEKTETAAKAEFDRRLADIMTVLEQQKERLELYKEAAVLHAKVAAFKARHAKGSIRRVCY
jgi:hypothetical protein